MLFKLFKVLLLLALLLFLFSELLLFLFSELLLLLLFKFEFKFEEFEFPSFGLKILSLPKSVSLLLMNNLPLLFILLFFDLSWTLFSKAFCSLRFIVNSLILFSFGFINIS